MKNVTFKQLRALAAVVRTGSVTAAAQKLNVSPPAVTLQMQLLQDQAGLPLVERSPGGTVATDAGNEILRAVDQIETILAQDLQSKWAAQVPPATPEEAKAYVAAHPDIHVELVIEYTEPAVRGDTSSGATKIAKLETGLEIKEPLFIKEGEKVKVSTENRDFAGRA